MYEIATSWGKFIHEAGFGSLNPLGAPRQYLQFANRVVRIQSLMRRYDIRKTQFQKLELMRTFLGAIYTMKLCL